MTSTITSTLTFEKTYRQAWPFGRYDDPATQLAFTSGGAELWTPAYVPTGGPSVPDVGALTITATADATGDVVIEHADLDQADVPWIADSRGRAEWWVRHPDVVQPGLVYSLVAEVVDGDGVLYDTLELYRDDAPAPGWTLATVPVWPVRDDVLFTSLRISHRWTGYAAGAPQLLTGDVIGLAAGLHVDPSDWTEGYFDGDFVDTTTRLYESYGTYDEVVAVFPYEASPELILDYAYERPARAIVHTVIGREEPDVTLRPVGLRTGQLVMFCLDRAQALELEDIHRHAAPLILDATEDEPTASMRYVVTGTLAVRWDAEHNRWTVTAGYQEVAP